MASPTYHHITTASRCRHATPIMAPSQILNAPAPRILALPAFLMAQFMSGEEVPVEQDEQALEVNRQVVAV